METNNDAIVENRPIETVSFAAYEASQDRWLRITLRLVTVIVVLAISLVGTLVGFLIYEYNHEDVVTTTFTQEGTADADGDVILNGSYEGEATYNGEGKADNNKNQNPRP